MFIGHHSTAFALNVGFAVLSRRLVDARAWGFWIDRHREARA